MMGMNDATKNFLHALKARPDVVGVILFGSWARGNNMPGSDVDLVIILTEGYQRTIEERDGQVFEIIYTTKDGALDYWKTHKDDAANLWQVAKIVYDKDGSIETLKRSIQRVIDAGKDPINDKQLLQLRFDAEDQIHYAESVAKQDITTANFMLTNKVFILTELFFDMKQFWTPAPKQRLSEIAKQDDGFYQLLVRFYDGSSDFQKK